jgi:hypothetical protein
MLENEGLAADLAVGNAFPCQKFLPIREISGLTCWKLDPF